VVAARLEVDVDRGAGGVPGIAKRGDLGMRPARALVPALADHTPLANDDRADDRVGRSRSPAPFGQLEAAVEVCVVGAAQRHATAPAPATTSTSSVYASAGLSESNTAEPATRMFAPAR